MLSSIATLSVRLRFSEHVQCNVQSAILRRAGIAGVVALEQADVLGPGIALSVGELRLERDQRGLAFARENGDVVALHAPVIGEIENVVRSADDQGGEFLILHQGANPVQLG